MQDNLVPIREAASIIGISYGALLMRVHRGAVKGFERKNGFVYVPREYVNRHRQIQQLVKEGVSASCS